MSKKATLTPRTGLANPREWSRSIELERFAKSIDSGREQEALWILDDGLVPSPSLLGEALCSAASQGMALLCDRMLRLGALSLQAVESPKLLIESDSWRTPVNLMTPRFSAPAQALLGGHFALAMKLEAAVSKSILGNGSTLEAARLMVSGKLNPSGKALVLERCAIEMPAATLSEFANWLCVAGRLDDALSCLEHAPVMEKGRIARAMVSPLCAYSPADGLAEIAIIALEQALDGSEGRLERSLAPWSYKDQFALSRPWGGPYGNKRSRREEFALTAAERSYGWSASRVGKYHAAWPRVAAGLCGNSRALALLETFPCSSDERKALAIMAEATKRSLACPLEHRGLPALFGVQCYGDDVGRFGIEPSSWSDMALAYYEKIVIAKTSSDAVKDMKKSKVRSIEKEQVPVSARRTNRL